MIRRRLWWRGLGGRHGDAEHVRQLLTSRFRRPGSSAELRPVQAAGLTEAFDFRGLLASMRVGSGKTLLSLLLPVVLQARRPILVVPGSLREKTYNEATDYSNDWQIAELAPEQAAQLLYPEIWPRGQLLVLTFDQISSDHVSVSERLLALTTHPAWRYMPGWVHEYATRLWVRLQLGLLHFLRPDLLMFDEIHRLSNRKSARTRRVGRYIQHVRATEDRFGDRLRVVGMTGSLSGKSILDYVHIANWCLGPNSPMPRDWNEAKSWAQVLDLESEFRPHLGALVRLVDPVDYDHLRVDPYQTVRRAFAVRQTETPGFLTVAEGDEITAGLSVQGVQVPLPDELARAIERTQRTWEKPSGEPFADATVLRTVIRQLASGFYYTWRNPPPTDWIDARRAWCSVCRRVLTRNRSGIDTELQVRTLAKNGRLGQDVFDAWRAWESVKDQFDAEKNRVPVWLSDFLVDHAVSWLRATSGVCWVQFRALGQRVADLAEVPYFQNKGRCGPLLIDSYTDPAVASIDSCSEGRNLQQYNQALVLNPPSSGRRWEQMLGRLHRDGQALDVSFDVGLTIPEHVADLETARAQATWKSETSQEPQKLISCAYDVKWVANSSET